MKLNTNYDNVSESYLFSEVAKRVSEYGNKNKDADIIRLGIGDVTLPLCKSVVAAMHKAADEMGERSTFRGYGPEQGYAFLRSAIKDYYGGFGVELCEDEIFISDGAKSDIGNILDLFDNDNSVLVPDPVYPVYVDTNTMAGRRVLFADATKENGFLPMPCDKLCADIIYICSPNNPTGAAYSREQLGKWVDYALENGSIILFDSAYECFITDKELPHSIFEIEGAKKCAIEFCSLSKTAGFTGMRCGYTVVPDALCAGKLRKMWLRRQTTKFNGVAYVVQRAAEAVFSQGGQREIKENIAYYSKNAGLISQTMDELGVFYTGGKNSPYIWLCCKNNMDGWEFFDYLLKFANVVGTPGNGFGKNGKNFFRLTAFASAENTVCAMDRFKKAVNK